MSGRSAYVRKEKAKVHDKPHRQPEDQHAGVDRFGFRDVVAVRSRRSSDGGAPSAVYTTAGYDTRSLNQYRSPNLAYESSAIEKSAFRAFMDGKSDAFRSKLSAKLGRKDAERQDVRFQNGQPSLPPVGMTIENGPLSPPPPKTAVKGNPESDLSDVYVGITSSRGKRQGSQLRQFVGGGTPARPWLSHGRDAALYDPTGDTELYFTADMAVRKAPASLRFHSSALEEARPGAFLNLLHESFRQPRNDGCPDLSSSPRSASIDTSGSPVERYMSAGQSPTDSVPPLFQVPRQPQQPSAIKSLNTRARKVTSSRSDSDSFEQDSYITHRLYFPAYPFASELDSLRYRLTTRNMVALATGKSFIGINLYQTLHDVLDRLRTNIQHEAEALEVLREYVRVQRLGDVRNDASSALGLLAFSEHDKVRWTSEWCECFVHCVGMYNSLTRFRDYGDLSGSTRKILDYNYLELRVRVHDCEVKLANFDFSDMWDVGCMQSDAVKASFEAFRKFLVGFYQRSFNSWPLFTDRRTSGEDWLSADLVQRLQTDFGSLYDFLVDRDMIWDESENRAERKWKIVRRGSKSVSFNADSSDVALTDIFVSFDIKHNFPHIPHPFPLCPASMAVPGQVKPARFGSSKKSKTLDTKGFEKRAALAYTEASNLFLLGSNFVSNPLVEAFSRHEAEKIPGIGDMNPYVARKGRWILLYGILQQLATLSVNTPGVQHSENVAYFLNASMEGTLPWDRGAKSPNDKHQQSYCWTTAQKWDRQGLNLGSESLSEASSNDVAKEQRSLPRLDTKAYPTAVAPRGPMIENLPRVDSLSLSRSDSQRQPVRSLPSSPLRGVLPQRSIMNPWLNQRARQWVESGHGEAPYERHSDKYDDDDDDESPGRVILGDRISDWPIRERLR